MLSKNTNSNYDRYYHWNSRLLFLVGLWPHQDRLDRFFRSCIVNVTIIVALTFQIHQLYIDPFEIGSIVKKLQILVLFLCCSMSYYTIILKFSTGQKLRDRIVLDWEQSSNETLIIFQRAASESLRCTTAIAIIFYIFGMSIIIPSVFHILLYTVHVTNDTQLTLPIPVTSLFHIEDYFYFAFTCEVVSISIISTLAIVVYSTYILCITHSCALLSLVAYKVGQPFKNDKHDAYDWIKEIVRDYTNAIEFIDTVNELGEKVYIVEIFLGILLVIVDILYLFQSIQMLQSSVLMQYVYEVFMCIVYIIGSIFTIYLNCYMGQKLLDHSAEVLESFYQVSLYELPLRCQKVLPLLILRSTKPCVISIGGYFVASHDFFARFMNTSLTYAMVCYNMR